MNSKPDPKQDLQKTLDDLRDQILSEMPETDQQAFLGTDIEADFAYYAQLEQVLDAYPPDCQ